MLRVNQLRLHGVRQISEGSIRERIATQPPSRILGVRPPWSHGEPFDPTTFRRDLERIERYYQAQGYYSAAVQTTRVEPNEAGREVDLDVTLREGPPTRVRSVWLSGCEPDSRQPDELFPVSEQTCERIRNEMHLHLGAVFSESSLDTDRQLITDLLKDSGHADAHVVARATVDPAARGAHVVFVLEAGPPGHFGEVDLYESADQPVRGARLPSGLPVGPIRSAIDIDPGQAYTRTALADAQRRLFELGVFGVARIVEEPTRCDSAGRCGSRRDHTDPRQSVRVNLKVYLSVGRAFRWRLGVGGEASQLQSNIHASANFEWLNAFQNMWRIRGEVRPLLFLPAIFSRIGFASTQFGVATNWEIRRPVLLPRLAFVSTLSGDYGPDPINPAETSRIRVAPSVGLQYRFDRRLTGAVNLRATVLDYLAISPIIRIDPILREEYISQAYAYLEEQITWDGRDSPLQPRRGFYFSALTHQGAPPSYLFLRGAVEARGYVPLGSNVVLAIRGSAGAVVGKPSGLLTLAGDTVQWPVPLELLFYSGGANSNRGYPYYRAGLTTTVPRQQCLTETGMQSSLSECTETPGTAFVIEPDANGNAQPDLRRLAAIGGLAAWEFSAEVRWYLGNWGLVAFFDASDVWGWQPPRNAAGEVQLPERPVRVTMPGPRTPPPSLSLPVFDPHPSAGIGIRYVTPIGVVRLDVGFRLDDITCRAYQEEVEQINAQTNNRPWYYVLRRPPCEVLGYVTPIPFALNFGIGEAF